MITSPFSKYNSLGFEEKQAALSVIDSGVLSGFIGSAGDAFLGGPKVRELETLVCEVTKSKYAISLNSWTSGLYTILAALGIGQGDEVITTPWTMCATATTIVAVGAKPVFADIQLDTYCIDPDTVYPLITNRTKAILAVDIFGYPCDYSSLRKIADDHNLLFIADSAQAWHSFYADKYASRLSDIGGFSLNYHKQINCGEGGIIITDNPHYARRCRLIRNHGEAALSMPEDRNNIDIIGFNFRLGEIEAAIAIEQIKKLPDIISSRVFHLGKLDLFFQKSEFFHLPKYSSFNKSSYYKYPLRLSSAALEIKDRSFIAEFLRDQGITIIQEGYAFIPDLLLYQNTSQHDKQISIANSNIAKALHEKEYLGLAIDLIELNEPSIDFIIDAFRSLEAKLLSLR